MPNPINYVQQVASPFQAAVSGLQLGSGIAELQAARQDQALKQQQQQQQQQALQDLMSNPKPTGDDYAKATLAIPQLREQFKQAWEMHSAEQQKSSIAEVGEVHAALSSDNPDVAINILETRAEALKNSNAPQAQIDAVRNMAESIKVNPDFVRVKTGLMLASIPGGDKVIEGIAKLGAEHRAELLAPEQLTESRAKATKAAVDAKFAESNAVIDLEKKGWDIEKLQSDMSIARENSRIAAINAQISRETNDLKKQELELKLADAVKKRDEEVRTRIAEAETALSGIDNSLNVIDRLLANPELDNILGAVEGSTFYPSTLISLISPFSDADKRADAQADLENIQSQSFLNNLMEAKSKGATFGALSDKEGDRLIGYVRNLKAKQSEKQFKENLAEIQRLLLKSRTNLANRAGIPESIPDTPDVVDSTTPEDIDAIIRKHLPGAQ